MSINKTAQRIHNEAIIIDMLQVLFDKDEEWGTNKIEYLQQLAAAGVTAVNATIPYVSEGLSSAVRRIAKFHKALPKAKNARLALRASDIENAKKDGKVAIIIGMQDSMPFETDLDLINIFYKLGVRIAQLAYSPQNYLGAGCVEQKDHGLTDRGKEAVKELNRLGILIDVSHCGNKTAFEAARVSEYPIAITHATPSHFLNIRRAKSDETIKAVAERGGVIGQVIEAIFNERDDKIGVLPTLADFVDIIDYLVNLVGVDHVGLGTDLTPFWSKEVWDEFHVSFPGLLLPHDWRRFNERWCKGFNGIMDMVKVTEELSRHGYSDEDVKKIMGGNWLRLIRAVWK